LKEQLKTLIENYYKAIGFELEDDLSLADLRKIAEKLPSITTHSYTDSNLKLEIENKAKYQSELKAELSEKELLLNQLSNNTQSSQNYANYLEQFKLMNAYHSEKQEMVCPVCKSNTPALVESVKFVLDSKNNLREELSKIGNYTGDCSEQIELLQKERDLLKKQIKKLTIEINNFEKLDSDFQKIKSFQEKSLILKGATESNIQHLLNQNKIVKGSIDLVEMMNRIKWLEEKLDGYDLKAKISEAETFLSKRMTEICNKLDFEAELKPGKLRFSLTDFSFYYNFNDKERIYLSEMGSGANWLSCHLSLFIAILHLNCKSRKSSIPSFLMIDQPSQVYFPREYRQSDNDKNTNIDENIAQVKNIFKVIAEEIKKINSDCGFEPQIIVMDHADEPEFNDFVKSRWKKDGDKLI